MNPVNLVILSLLVFGVQLAATTALLKRMQLAIKNYKRSLELDPKNTNAVQQLKKLNPE